jgi:phage-related protein
MLNTMPWTEVSYYCDEDGTAPVLEWLADLAKKNRKAAEKCAIRIETLRQMGHELRRPIADYLRDGIYELRIRHNRVQCRILYFFHGVELVILAHGLMKEKEVPDVDIERAVERRQRFIAAPNKHTLREESDGNN